MKKLLGLALILSFNTFAQNKCEPIDNILKVRDDLIDTGLLDVDVQEVDLSEYDSASKTFENLRDYALIGSAGAVIGNGAIRVQNKYFLNLKKEVVTKSNFERINRIQSLKEQIAKLETRPIYGQDLKSKKAILQVEEKLLNNHKKIISRLTKENNRTSRVFTTFGKSSNKIGLAKKLSGKFVKKPTNKVTVLAIGAVGLLYLAQKGTEVAKEQHESSLQLKNNPSLVLLIRNKEEYQKACDEFAQNEDFAETVTWMSNALNLQHANLSASILAGQTIDGIRSNVEKIEPIEHSVRKYTASANKQ